MTRRFFSSLPAAIAGTVPVQAASASPSYSIEITVSGADEHETEMLSARLTAFLAFRAPKMALVEMNHNLAKSHGLRTHTFANSLTGEFRDADPFTVYTS